MLKKIITRCNGLRFPQEYLCLSTAGLSQPLQAYLVAENRVVRNITSHHLFTGYSPLLLTLFEKNEPGATLPERVLVRMTPETIEPNAILASKDAIAEISLEKIYEDAAGEPRFAHYRGCHGKHRFVSPFSQYMTALYNHRYNRRPGNVYLRGNLYRQVEIAYAIPRKISLITTGYDGRFNLFPTDLHGPMGEEQYIGSLRHAGLACRQVEATRRIVLSDMEPAAQKLVYNMGKNHMREWRSIDALPFGPVRSPLFGLPVPQDAIAFRELELVDSFTCGIHKLLRYRTLFTQHSQAGQVPLEHIHNAYASWRYNKGLPGNYLLR